MNINNLGAERQSASLKPEVPKRKQFGVCLAQIHVQNHVFMSPRQVHTEYYKGNRMKEMWAFHQRGGREEAQQEQGQGDNAKGRLHGGDNMFFFQNISWDVSLSVLPSVRLSVSLMCICMSYVDCCVLLSCVIFTPSLYLNVSINQQIHMETCICVFVGMFLPTCNVPEGHVRTCTQS